MARFSLVFAAAGLLLLVAMAAVAEASITTTAIEENARGSGSSCYQQVMDQGMLDQCTMYLMNNVRGGHQQGSRRRSSGDEQMQMCCMQLENLGQECMCSGIKMMMNQPMWSTMGMGQMMGQMMSMAQNLPTQCGLMSQSCQMRAVWY
ncbi:hypothetical protein SSX86_032542 [Deinandra increscens subsp. villosa]|uniref:Bifunctional inhibitor/plant lipid transfer protein/seed storage helical domain-containing protein n=1 Tax=Deinandra increscens subsp. villosa TaxID=3103831 RepID=A0AAP0GGJ0_9ASTR